MDLKNLSVIRQSFAQCVFNHHIYEAAANINVQKAKKIKYLNIIIISLVVISIVLHALYIEELIFSYIGLCLSIIEIIFLIIQLNFDYNKKVVQHKNVALRFLDLRDRYKNLIVDVMSDKMNSIEIILARDTLQSEYSTICSLSSQVGDEEYKIAQEKLNPKGVIEGEAFTWSDEEIDRFLPEELRLKK